MKDIHKATARVMKARESGEKVTIYGDYDADGPTAAALLFLFLKHMEVNVSCYIPHRMKEGYGLNRDAVRRLADTGTDLLITVDCGISNIQEISLAHSLKMDVIVTDHHQPPPVIPKALAILNPKQVQCPYPYKDLAGVGIAFLLAVALRAAMKEAVLWKEHEAPNLKNFLDLVALGTIADQVPLTGQNRILTIFGLEVMNSITRTGIEALKEISGLREKPILSWNVAFQLAPRLNAGGRMGEPSMVFKLLTTENYDEAREIAEELNRLNLDRQKVEDRIVQEAQERLSLAGFSPEKRSIVLASENWHQGVVGIVASRILERFHRPTFIISLQDGIGRGSGRSIKGFDLYQALQECAPWLLDFGGHPAAAGIKIHPQNLEPFSNHFEQVAGKILSEKDLKPRIKLDAETSLEEIGLDEVLQLKRLEPFGAGNPEPVWLGRRLAVERSEKVGNRHLRLTFRLPEGNYAQSIGFGMGHVAELVESHVDAAFTVYLDQWKGTTRLGLKLKDIKNPE